MYVCVCSLLINWRNSHRTYEETISIASGVELLIQVRAMQLLIYGISL